MRLSRLVYFAQMPENMLYSNHGPQIQFRVELVKYEMVLLLIWKQYVIQMNGFWHRSVGLMLV